MELIDLDLCNSTQWYNGRIRSTNVCAGYPQGKIDTCQVTFLWGPRPLWTPLSWIPELHYLQGPALVTPSLVPFSSICSHSEDGR